MPIQEFNGKHHIHFNQIIPLNIRLYAIISQTLSILERADGHRCRRSRT